MTRILTAGQVRSLIPYDLAIELMEAAFLACHRGEAIQPEPVTLLLREDDPAAGQLFVKPAWLPGHAALASKLVTVFPANSGRGIPTTLASLSLVEPETGEVVALMDGTWITAVRTAAGSALAARYLARPDAHVLAVIGSGPLARAHVETFQLVRPIDEVRVFSRRPVGRTAFAAWVRDSLGLRGIAAASAEAAVAGADVVVTATTSATPVVSDGAIAPGTHISSVGSYLPGLAELSPMLVRRSRVYADDLAAAWRHSGLLQDHESRRRSVAAIGAVCAGEAPGRSDPAEITLFVSIGLGIQDAIVAAEAYRRASAAGVGLEVDLLG